MSLYLRIQCDGCGCISAVPALVGKQAHAQRSILYGSHGWAVGCYSVKDRHASGAKDFCPRCIQDYVRAKRPRGFTPPTAPAQPRRLRLVGGTSST